MAKAASPVRRRPHTHCRQRQPRCDSGPARRKRAFPVHALACAAALHSRAVASDARSPCCSPHTRSDAADNRTHAQMRRPGRHAAVAAATARTTRALICRGNHYLPQRPPRDGSRRPLRPPQAPQPATAQTAHAAGSPARFMPRPCTRPPRPTPIHGDHCARRGQASTGQRATSPSLRPPHFVQRPSSCRCAAATYVSAYLARKYDATMTPCTRGGALYARGTHGARMTPCTSVCA